jgi:murein DD-endopeptidase MepM/ murein hydrolase activator NlpD
VAVGAPVVRRRATLLVLATLAAALGCHPPVVRHRVKPGDTLYRIGKAYGVEYGEVARANGLENPDRIEVGQELVIPHATRELPVEVITPVQSREDRPAPTELPRDRVAFIWPVDGPVIAPFGERGDVHHDGIDIAAAAGTPVRAARSGRVLYSDELRGYGKLLILEHGDGYATVYAHDRLNAVTVGALVHQGDAIAEVGDTGDSLQPSLHFEVRRDNVARNPLFYLPPRRAAARGASAP